MNVRVQEIGIDPTLCGMCVGYEQEKWRVDHLVNHIVTWLPEFALTPTECLSIDHANSVELIRKASQIVYNTEKFKKRGEFGELFLHAIIRQVHDSLPAISKIYYKSAANDTVKGFDAVHVVDGGDDEIELWLGEAKFYDNATRAVRDVAAELEDHLKTDYLRGEFLLIGNKLDDALPQKPALKKLLNHDTSLDEVFARVCIPVLLTYNSKCISSHKKVSTEYLLEFRKEIENVHKKFAASMAGKAIPEELRIHLFLMPLEKKSELVKALDRKLKTWQNL